MSKTPVSTHSVVNPLASRTAVSLPHGSVAEPYSSEIRGSESLQGKVGAIAAKVEYESQPYYVAGKLGRRLFDAVYNYFVPVEKTASKQNLRKNKAALVSGQKVSVSDFQAEIDARKRDSSGSVVDLSDLSGVVLQGEMRDIYLHGVHGQREVIENLNVSGTNFLSILMLIENILEIAIFRDVVFATQKI